MNGLFDTNFPLLLYSDSDDEDDNMINPTPAAEFTGIVDQQQVEDKKRLAADNCAIDIPAQEVSEGPRSHGM